MPAKSQTTIASIIPANEADRLAAVRRYEILDTPPDGAFDRITAIAARRFNVPISIVSIVDHDRIWFKSHHGLDVAQIGRDPGLCASAILSNEPRILPDAKADPHALANPLVAGEFGLRFYVGVPLETHDGYNLGTLCVIAKEPRDVRKTDVQDLQDLAAVVMDQIELRLSARRAVGQARILMREIDHRVMNSLSFVSAMLAMQGRAADDPEVSNQLEIAANRVGAVARVHRHFYADEASERIGCLAYVRRLSEDLSNVLQTTVETAGTEVIIPTKQIQPVGLIVNELVTNAAKYGEGRIVVAVGLRGDSICSLSVSDEGKGVPADFDPVHPASGLGMKLITTLARQLEGTLSVQPNPSGKGSCFIVNFPLSKPQTSSPLHQLTRLDDMTTDCAKARHPSTGTGDGPRHSGRPINK